MQSTIFVFQLDYYGIDFFTFDFLHRVSAILVVWRTGTVPSSVWTPSLILTLAELTCRSISKRAKTHLTPVSISRHTRQIPQLKMVLI